MAALVQTIPQQSGTVPVLQTRPSSSSGTFTSSSQNPQQQNARNPTMSWNTYNTVGSSGSYRAGHQVVAPYAFTSTPNLSTPANVQNRQSWSPHLRPEHRTSSAPSAPQLSPSLLPVGVNSRSANHFAAGSVSTSSSNSSVQSHVSKDDTAIPSRQLRSEPPLRPLSTVNLPSPSSSSFMNISSPTVRPSPDRYRRGSRRPDSVVGTPPATTTTNASGPSRPQSESPDENHLQEPPRNPGHHRGSSADDTSRGEKSQPELAKRYRRRSWGNMDNAGLINLQLHLPTSSPTPSAASGTDYFDTNHRPRSAQSHRDVTTSIHSTPSSTSSAREPGTPEPASSPSQAAAKPEDSKRAPKPSPLSQPVDADPTPVASPTQPESKARPTPMSSAATQRLEELSKSDLRRPGKSRLRRAFSFGSASELLKASAQTSAGKKEAIALEKARRELLQEELGPEQAAIAEQQEASGLGESIYSHHQGRFFNSSTDNLSVSSTASSASIMLRKMGKGMKRSTRSLVGLFRPKSVISTASTDAGAIEPMAPQLSVVNIEAERKSVTVNPDPQDLPRGGTVFPKVEPTAPEVSGHDEAALDKARKSIVGGDRERAEVLAAVRKGILKKTHSDPTAGKPSEGSQTVSSNDTPHSSAPSTPEDQTRSGSRRPETVRIAGDDDFLSVGRFGESKSAPISPQAVAPKSLVFSPRIQFHDTWPSGEYDRRGDIATCNRLTPLLAQQIKEELNNFKMVCLLCFGSWGPLLTRSTGDGSPRDLQGLHPFPLKYCILKGVFPFQFPGELACHLFSGRLLDL
ncbi:hypothetical protein P170DRAFT_368106 [Aspergillus steynii IBT 23096]|uniref:Uncharacterized protein n=1 Tax=Aspergillus steynii IBT 23096 TaxID=1392250 RepID=A0A2I2FVF1_9EURO|nr:uncharacterized protein P170DRAFT_368106 [Aspergillus steynii IBT 23096]PLB44602.1 hypothetical protein P170DRAFT_368106 [Aspergillus steynii IBT 23096]